jgi:flagellar hook assembly protein FlgD
VSQLAQFSELEQVMAIRTDTDTLAADASAATSASTSGSSGTAGNTSNTTNTGATGTAPATNPTQS